MKSFGEFLVGMGYPESAASAIPTTARGRTVPTRTPSAWPDRLPGTTRATACRPMIIGHSQGGMQAVKILHVLAGDYGASVPVWNPLTDFPENRTSIVDPMHRRTQPVVGLRVAYVSVGRRRRRRVPPAQPVEPAGQAAHDSRHRRGIHRLFDRPRLLGVDACRGSMRRAISATAARANVRNVTLPAAIQPRGRSGRRRPPATTGERGLDRGLRPGAQPAAAAGGSAENILWAADVWCSVKKYWVIEAQRLIRAKRAAPAPAVAGTLE